MSIPKTSLFVVLVALAAGSQASANLLTNPGFEDPVGPEWTFTILSGDPTNWTSGASSAYLHSGANSYGIAYGPVATTGKAYVEQILSGLTPGDGYDVSGWLYFGWRADKDWAYIEALGGGAAVQAPAKAANVVGSWQQYTLSQTADAGGNLTVRLYLDKYATTTADKVAWVYFDDMAVTVIPEPTTLAMLAVAGLALVVRRRAAWRRT